MIKQSSETSHFIFTGIELSGTSTVIFWLIYKYIFGIPLKCRPTTSRLLFKGGSAWCGATPLLPSLPSPPSSVISPSRPALVGCVRFKFRDFKLPAACFLSWSPENNAAVNGGERVFTHYMRVKSAHLGVVLVLIGLFPPVAAPSVCSIFQCPPVLAVFTAVHLTSNLGFPHRWCLVSLALWTPAHPRRSSAAVPCTAFLCLPLAAIRMLVDFSWSVSTRLAQDWRADHVIRSGMCGWNWNCEHKARRFQQKYRFI